MGGRVDVMLPILDTDKDCFAITPRALMQAKWDGKKWCYPSNKLDNNSSGVYAIFSFRDGFLYVGKAKKLRGRLRGHFGFNHHCAFNCLYDMMKEFDYNINTKDLTSCLIIIFPINDPIERTKAEIEVIRETEPIYNLRCNPRYD